MKTGSWYVTGFTITFLYFYIYAVNYVRGSAVPLDKMDMVRFYAWVFLENLHVSRAYRLDKNHMKGKNYILVTSICYEI